MFFYILSFLIALIIWNVYSVIQRQKHFQSQGVFVPPHWPFLGHIYDLFFRSHKWKVHDEYYRKYKQKKLFGMYELGKPNLFITDIELAKAVAVKDAEHFIDRRNVPLSKTGHEVDTIFTQMLTMLRGEKWKYLRNRLSPTFSSGKMKAMFPLIADSAQNLAKYYETKTSRDGSVRAEVGAGKYVLSVVASCVFGMEIPIADNSTDFERFAQTLIAFTPGDFVRGIIIYCLPEKLVRLIGIQFAKPPFNYFVKLAKDTIAERKRIGIRRNDFVDLLTDLKTNTESTGIKDFEITDNLVVAQFNLFLLAGYDTVTVITSFTTHLLAQNQEVQDKLCQELRKARGSDGKFTYESITDCVYLDAVLNESFRYFQTGFMIERECSKEYRVPGTDVIVKPGEIVTVPTWSFAHDPEYWEDPHQFNPDRFLPENKDKVPPFCNLPFGAGPRNCIAMRFAILKTKVALSHIIVDHRIKHAPGKEELILDSGSFSFRSTKHGIHIVCERI